MWFLRNKRRLGGLAALGALVALMLLVVFPALASNPGDFVLPASGAGVAPYDVAVGGTGDCANLFTGNRALGAVSEYDNVNPKTKKNLSSGHGDGVTFDVMLHADTNQSQTLDVVAHGAAILGIGIKGGTQSTAYNYKVFKQPPGFVTSDTGLHAPLQSFTTTTVGTTTTESGTQFYSISQLTVCYTVLSYIEGTVYQDVNQNGTNDDTSPRADWTVNLYAGVTSGVAGGGQLVTSQQMTNAGGYHFDVPANATYRVCEVPKAADTPSNGGTLWVETQPAPSTTTLCNGQGELPKGYDVAPAQLPAKNADFGNVGGYPCNEAPVGVADYTVGKCKANQLYVFNSGTTGNGAPFVDYWVGDPTKASIPVVEQINFDDPFVSGQPKYTKLLYADGGGFPPSFNNLLQMPYCTVDPRDPAGSDGYALQAQYQTLNGSSSVLPTGQTSCVISIKTTAPVASGGPGKLQAYVYALGDSVRVGN